MVTDLGFAKRARTFAELVDAPLAIVEKRRMDSDGRAEVLNVIGEVRGRRAIVVDDEVDTAGTLMEITRALEREGVPEMHACATHGVLSGSAIERIEESNLTEVVITDTIPLPKRLPKIASSRWRRSSARPSGASMTPSRWAPCSRRRCSWSRRWASGATGSQRRTERTA